MLITTGSNRARARTTFLCRPYDFPVLVLVDDIYKINNTVTAGGDVGFNPT